MSGRKYEKEFTISAKYLILPIQNKGKSGKLGVYVDGESFLDYEVGLATGPDTTDWYAFFSIDRFKGKKAKVVVSRATENGFALVKQSDTIPGEEGFYGEQLRPQYHFTAKTGWLNDPNGLVFCRGVYHLYYQHNPVALPWGNMTWGHAVSSDLVHWKEQPKVLFPDAKTGTCFSGAMFIDRKNQLGRKSGREDVLVAFYLRTKLGLCLAYSNDQGQTFVDYEENPVLTHRGARIDTPRPFWHGLTERWVAPTYDFFTNSEGEKRRCVGFYSSENLKEWHFESRVEQDGWGDELCGCVDFFQLPLDGDPMNAKWIMILIDGSYIAGDFNGHTFYTDAGRPAKTADRIRSLVISGNYYATMTWHNMPDTRRVQITWMKSENQYPGMPFNQQMTIPSELTLHSTDDGPRLRMNPAQELEMLRIKTHEWTDLVLKAEENPLLGLEGDLFDLEVEFEPSAGSEAIFGIRGNDVIYDSESQTLSSCGTVAKLEPIDGALRLRILLDRSSIEVFGNDGRVYIPKIVFSKEDDLSLRATCARGEINARYLRVHELRSSWEAG